jgi:hypothetical protein
VRTSTLPYYWSIYFIFFRMNPFAEPRCGPMTGAGGDPLPLQSSAISPAMTESDLPQPLVVRSPSVSMMKWPSTPSPTKTTPTRQVSPPHVPTFFLIVTRNGAFQVSFNYGKDEVARTLSGLERDCFIIPVHSLDRFLPAGVPLPVGIRSRTEIGVVVVGWFVAETTVVEW